MTPEQEQLRKRISGTGEPGVAVTALQLLVSMNVEPKLINAAINRAVQLEQVLTEFEKQDPDQDALKAIVESRKTVAVTDQSP